MFDKETLTGAFAKEKLEARTARSRAAPNGAVFVPIRTVQELLGHEDVATTMIYTRVMSRPGVGVKSPLDG